VPYDLPGNKTRMVMRSNTHKGTGFNEMTFEDDAGRENMFFHAQKDQTTRIRNDRTKRVDRHEVASIGGNRAVEVSGNQKHEIGGSVNTVVGGTGPMAMALMGAVQGLSGQTAGLLSQAGQIAGGGGEGLAAFAGTLASSALGFLGVGGLGSREGVVSGPNPRADAGTNLSGSGSGLGEAAGGLFPLPGIMNTIVGSFKSDTIGIARAEQIGVSKVTNVGQTSLEKVGKFKKVIVGEEFVIECGASKFIMRQDGTVIILGTHFNFTASGPTQINGKVVDLNKPGGGFAEASPTSSDTTAQG
jgi:type VI secretion system secreted protein VgrG